MSKCVCPEICESHPPRFAKVKQMEETMWDMSEEISMLQDIIEMMNIWPAPYGNFKCRWEASSFNVNPIEDAYLKKLKGIKD